MAKHFAQAIKVLNSKHMYCLPLCLLQRMCKIFFSKVQVSIYVPVNRQKILQGNTDAEKMNYVQRTGLQITCLVYLLHIGGFREAHPPSQTNSGPICFIPIQFSRKIGQIMGCPRSEKSWIFHCLRELLQTKGNYKIKTYRIERLGIVNH